jgi:hypothetical protein
MKATDLKDATAATIVPPMSEIHGDTTGNVYFFPKDQATASSNVYRARWDHAEHIEDFQMLAKLKTLSDESKGQVKTLVAELYEAEQREREENRRLAREAFELTKRSLARYWGAEDDAEIATKAI